ncbi:outer-membrane lipoprotein carrier protein LolA [Methyloceanibacter sp. wino2]|uniref:LolA family protein n=1 Tax=Methyloceanibacter sp. wino2 TaxID=2170729 RepID=UPI000D3E7FA3|nr:outer-membrane lipoprotein carrier protein LolA [Methyloceanibacter sp. wino2]
MTKGCAARAAAGLPIAFCLTMGLAYAQGSSTTVTKTPAPQPASPEALRPSIDQSVLPVESAVPVEEVVPPKVDEGGSWQVAVEQAKGPTPLVGQQQAAAVSKINAYFNGMTSLEGNFSQTDASNNRTHGRFYVLRPGKIRFDYAPPSPLRIVADGHSLGIQDTSLKTVEKYPIKSTPFRLLLGKTVDLGRDAKIVGVERDNGSLAITLEDQKGTAGHIRLLFKSGGTLELQEWTITDAQGLTTRVTVDSLVRGRKKSPTFFKIKEETNPFRMGG